GIFEDLAVEGNVVRLILRRTEAEGQPRSSAVLTRAAWENREGAPAPVMGDFIFVEGLVETLDGEMRLRLSSREQIWEPIESGYFVSKGNIDKSVDWNGLRKLPQDSHVKVSGTLLSRNAAGSELGIGSGRGEFVLVRLRPTSPGRKLRFGEYVKVRGRLAFDDAEDLDLRIPIVKKAFLLSPKRFAVAVPDAD
ncbi:MAG: hypothetical protein ACYTFG_21625, partial [Planctomycetota bacterium]